MREHAADRSQAGYDASGCKDAKLIIDAAFTELEREFGLPQSHKEKEQTNYAR